MVSELKVITNQYLLDLILQERYYKVVKLSSIICD